MTRTEEIAKARKVDTEIARLWDIFHDANDKLGRQQKALDEALDTRKGNSRWSPVGSFNWKQNEERIPVLEAKVAELRPIAAAARTEAIAYDEEHYEGWSRFFLVKHIHSSQHCSSFRWNTRIGWLPSVSGLTEAEAVKEHGATLCTICFPSAPVELTTKPVDPSLCSGSGKYHSTEHLTGRENAYYSPAGYCPDCLRWTTLTKTGVTRKHKVDETKRSAV